MVIQVFADFEKMCCPLALIKVGFLNLKTNVRMRNKNEKNPSQNDRKIYCGRCRPDDDVFGVPRIKTNGETGARTERKRTTVMSRRVPLVHT